jgi:mycothiol synthase
MELAESLNVRPCTLADTDTVVAVIAADEELVTGRPSLIGTGDVLSWWAQVDLAGDSWLVEDDGTIAGIGWLERHAELAIVVVVEAPAKRGRGIRATLTELAEDRARVIGVERLHQLLLVPDDEGAAFFAGRAFREVRRFWDMAITLESRPVEPALPPGLILAPLRESDIRAYHAAMGEAFEDHWEHHHQPFDQWWATRSTDPDFDLGLWFAVYDGATIAAGVRSEPNRNGGGYVASLGVRRPWRRLGLAKALLLHSFAAFWDRGVTRVTLGVDASNPTGATHLYEGVGMHPELVTAVFEKALT